MPFLQNYQKLLKRGENMLEYFVGFIIGFVASILYFKKRFNNGNFQINETDASKDVYTLFVDDFNKIHKRRYLLLKITRK